MSRWIPILLIVVIGMLLGAVFSPADPLSAIVFSGLLVAFGLWAQILGRNSERSRQRELEFGSAQKPASQFRLLTLLAVVLAVAVVCWLIRRDRSASAILRMEVSEPAANVQIDGHAVSQTVDATGTVRTIEVAPGQHRLTIELNGFRTVSDDFEVQPGGRIYTHTRLVPNSAP